MLGASLVAAAAWSPAPAITVVYRAVLVNGQAAPGLPGETLNVANLPLAIPTAPVIDSSGRFVSLAARVPSLRAVIVAGDSRAQPPTLRIVAKVGDQVPGLPQGVVLAAFRPFLQIAADGTAIFGATLSGPGITAENSDAWLVEPGPGQPVRVLVRTGDSLVDLPGAVVTSLNPLEQAPTAGASGAIGMTVLTSIGWAMLRADVDEPGPPRLLAAQEQVFSSQDPGARYTSVASELMAIDSDELIAPVQVAGQSLLAAYPPGPGAPRVLMRQGDVVDGRTIGVMSSFSMTNHGSGVVAMGTSLDNGSGILVGSAGDPAAFRIVAASGTAVPQIGPSVVFSTVGTGLVAVSGDGRAAFAAMLSGSGISSGNNTAIFTEGPEGPGAARLLLREGSGAVGLPSAATIRSIDRYGSWCTDLAINRRRQTLLTAGLQGTGVTTSNDYAMWAVDATGQLQLLMREGSPLVLSASDTRTVATIATRRLGGAAPSRGWLNDAGEFIADVAFTDGTRTLLVGTLDPAPCPADFNGMDGVTVQDVFDFLAAWFAGTSAADVDGSGAVALQDLFVFLARYFAPCA